MNKTLIACLCVIWIALHILLGTRLIDVIRRELWIRKDAKTSGRTIEGNRLIWKIAHS